MKKIIFIQSTLSIGGIETFLLRLARELNEKEIVVNFILLHKSGADEQLITSLSKIAEIDYWEDLIRVPKKFSSKNTKFLLPLNQDRIREILNRCDYIHVANSLTYFCAERILSFATEPVRCIFGIYHSNELAWSFSGNIPLYEKYFRARVFNNPGVMFYFFNDYSLKVTVNNNKLSKINSVIFPLGVDIPKSEKTKEFSIDELKIVAVGRLVRFKTYNLYFLDVIRELIDKGIKIKFFVYGSGPLEQEMEDKVERLSLRESVFLKGDVEYSLLDDALRKYDLFIGSGTALLHAAANGLPCITAIENELSTQSYGFFSDIVGLNYHEQNLNIKKVPFSTLVSDFYLMSSKDKEILSSRHKDKSSIFNMKSCAENFIICASKTELFKSNKSGIYIFSFIFFFSEIKSRITRGKKYSEKYEQKL